MTFKMKGFSAFTKKAKKDYEPQTKAGGREHEDKVRRSDLDEKGKKVFDSKGYEPQTKTRGYKGGEHADMMPQTQIDKADTGRLEGEIMGIYDNEYMEAKERGDKSAIKRFEQNMLKLKREIKNKGGKDESGVNMSNF